MRKNAPRKWIHAILDLLPLFVIPMFALMVRSDNGWEPISIDVQQVEKVKYSQILNTNLTKNAHTEYTNIQWYDYHVNISHINNSVVPEYPRVYGIGDLEIGHKYYFRAIPISNYGALGGRFLDSNGVTQGYFTPYGNIITASYPKFDLYANFPVNAANYNMSFYLNIFDLTYMYGAGNEPSIQDFNTSYTNDFYLYGLNTYYLLNKGTITYNDTDIGSQFLYSVYKPVNDYFNFNNLFNMQGIYDWLQLNLFGGNAPLPVLIVWNIIVYEFFIDLIFLLYSVFMFIIDFATHMIDSFTGRCR